MTTFTLYLQSHTQHEKFENVVSFKGEDASGQFGILAHHDYMMTCLVAGLIEYRFQDQQATYVALPGGILYFLNNELYIATRTYFKSQDYANVVKVMDEKIKQEEEELIATKESLHHLDTEMMKRLWELKRYE